jgi:hypothetical protein
MKHRSDGITPLTVDMTAAQRAVVALMLARISEEISTVAGMLIQIGMRAFCHLLLKCYTGEIGNGRSEDQPTPAGWRDSSPDWTLRIATQ